MDLVRPAAVAGLFYSNKKSELISEIESSFSQALIPKTVFGDKEIKALIVPHAGLVYSGPIAASAYDLLKSSSKRISRVVLFGPAHRWPVQGMAIPSVSKFSTPLGEIELDKEALTELAQEDFVEVSDQAHAQEHSLEVQLPFLQSVLSDFRLVPVVIGDSSPKQVSQVMAKFYGQPGTLVVISSDLSHFHPYEVAQQMDRETCEAIVNREGDLLNGNRACGFAGIRGLIKLLETSPGKISLLDLRNSGDTQGSRDEVVGYGSFVVY